MITYFAIGSESGVSRSSTQEADWTRSHVQHWRALTDDPAIGAAAVRVNAPVSIGQSYATDTESDPGSFCQRVSAVEDSQADDGRQWVVTAEYGPFNVLEQRPEVPFVQRPKLSFGWAEYQKVQTQDANGDPMVNSAEDYYDPPIMQDDPQPIMTIVRNEPSFDLGLVSSCKGRINDAPWFGRPAKWWKCLNITAEEAQDPDGSIYFVVTYEFAMNPDEWTLEVLDQGMNEIVSGKKIAITDRYGVKVQSPWPLNADGTKKAVGDQAEFIVYDVLEAIDFSVFNLDTFYNDEVTAGRLV